MTTPKSKPKSESNSNSNPSPKEPAAARSISAKLAELNAAMEWFYGEDFSLDLAQAHYQQAIKLANEVKADLEHLKNEIIVLEQDFSQA